MIAIDKWHRCWNETERVNQDIYAEFKLKKPFGLHGLYESISAL